MTRMCASSRPSGSKPWSQPPHCRGYCGGYCGGYCCGYCGGNAALTVAFTAAKLQRSFRPVHSGTCRWGCLARAGAQSLRMTSKQRFSTLVQTQAQPEHRACVCSYSTHRSTQDARPSSTHPSTQDTRGRHGPLQHTRAHTHRVFHTSESSGSGTPVTVLRFVRECAHARAHLTLRHTRTIKTKLLSEKDVLLLTSFRKRRFVANFFLLSRARLSLRQTQTLVCFFEQYPRPNLGGHMICAR